MSEARRAVLCRFCHQMTAWVDSTETLPEIPHTADCPRADPEAQRRHREMMARQPKMPVEYRSAVPGEPLWDELKRGCAVNRQTRNTRSTWRNPPVPSVCRTVAGPCGCGGKCPPQEEG